MKSASYIIIVHLFCINFAFGQGTIRYIDSLNTVARSLTDFNASNALFKQTFNQSKTLNYTNGIVDAVIGQGMNLHNYGKFEESIRLTYTFENLALTTENNAKISNLYALRGNSYTRLFFYERSAECLNLAKKYADKIIDNDQRNYSLGRIYGIMAISFKDQKAKSSNLDSALYYRMKSYQMQKEIHAKGVIKGGLIIQTNDLGRIYILKNNMDSARHYYDEAIALIKENKLNRFLGDSYLGLGDIFLKERNLDSALYFYHNALDNALKTRYVSCIEDSYQRLAEVYELKGNRAKSYEYLKKHNDITDSLANSNKIAVKISSDFILKDKESQFKRKSTKYLLFIISAIALLAVTIYTIIFLRKRIRKTVVIHKEKQEHLYEELSYLKEKTVKDNIDELALKEIIDMAVNNDPAFLIKFKEHHPVFMQKLMDRAPSFVTSDLLICAHLRLGFYTKEIARYTKTSVRAVEGKKYRIRKKLNINATEDINVWMIQL